MPGARYRVPGAKYRVPGAAQERSFMRHHAWMFAAIVAVLCATTDDRHVGVIADGRQMIWTAIAIAETGGLGQARARDLTVPRPAGDSVSRYGLGMSLAQLPAATVAPRVEQRLGPGSSQPLFLVAPFLCVLAAAAFAGLAARELGAAAFGQRAAILLSTLASPLAAYVALDFSEPLQAAALGGSFYAALIAQRTARKLVAAVAGAAVGLALLTKTALIVVAPLTLLPLLHGTHWRTLIVAAAAGFLPLATTWLGLELSRFGRPFASYAGESFSHPFWDGVWRLLVGPTKGLFLYYPALTVALAGGIRATRRPSTVTLLGGALAPFIALLLLAAPWWAWHGVEGWGPRLVIPAIPLLAACAALGIDRWRPALAYAFLAISVVLNVPPLLQHPTPVLRYMWSCAWPPVDQTFADALPEFARRHETGVWRVPPDQVLATVPRASPFVVLPWFFRVARLDDEGLSGALQMPPWSRERPDIRPTPPLSSPEAREVARRSRWSFWGHGFAPDRADTAYGSVYDRGLADQVIRLQQLRRRDDALKLAEKLMALAPSGFADALLLESYRLFDRRPDAVRWLTALPVERRAHPAINVVLALWERDGNNEPQARALLGSVAASFPGSPVERALSAPLDRWPADFGAMTADDRLSIGTKR